MSEPIDIELLRGQAGLGFNIKGGIDIPHVKGDPGIFVAKIRDSGAACDDGRLKEGDKIIEINGNNVEKVQHQDAVAHFLNAGSNVKLKVIPGAEAAIKKLQEQKNMKTKDGPRNIQRSSDSQGWSNSSLTILALGTLAVAIYIGYRYHKQ